MDTVLKLSEYGKRIGSSVRIIGIPKTIDNDLCETDHTPGLALPQKYIASSLLEIAHDTFIYAVKSVTIVEIMGRDAGWLTAAAALARNGYNTAPHLIYLPEVAFDPEDFLLDVKRLSFSSATMSSSQCPRASATPPAITSARPSSPSTRSVTVS